MSKLLICLIKFYRKCISPLKLPCCRFTPTCSQYAIEAIQIHGSFKGTALAIWRILRCNPLCRGGYDPVPEKRKNFKNNRQGRCINWVL